MKAGGDGCGRRAVLLLTLTPESRRGRLGPGDAGKHRPEPLLVLVHRQVHDALSAELDGNRDVRGADLPLAQAFQHLQELVDRLFRCALHLW